jgi:hypothetical protein
MPGTILRAARSEQTSILYNLVFNIDENGLPKNIPYPDAYTHLMEEPGKDSMLTRELMITGQYLVYARKILTGIPEAQTTAINWYIPRKKIEYTVLLDSILDGKLLHLINSSIPSIIFCAISLKHIIQ